MITDPQLFQDWHIHPAQTLNRLNLVGSDVEDGEARETDGHDVLDDVFVIVAPFISQYEHSRRAVILHS